MGINRIKQVAFCTVIISVLFACKKNESPTGYVFPFIGTEGQGNLNPGACVPFGMVCLGPDNIKQKWDAPTGYNSANDNRFAGFSHTHLNGTGCGDFKDISILPLNTLPNTDTAKNGVQMLEQYGITYSQNNEYAIPGYYKLSVPEKNITIELSASERCGIHRYTFKKDTPAFIAIDLGNIDETCVKEIVLASGISRVKPNMLSGFRFTKGWALNQKVFFAIRFTQTPDEFYISESGQSPMLTDSLNGTKLRAFAKFNHGGTVEMAVGLSAVSKDGALLNLDTEVGTKHFDDIRETAHNKWEAELNKIKVKTNDKDEKTVFYTALYNTLRTPSLLSDVNGFYRGANDSIYTGNGDYYGTWSLWDTYRAVHPLFTIIEPNRVSPMVNSLLKVYQHFGLLPVWNLWSNENWCMVGYPAVPVIAEAYLKGFRGFDTIQAFNAVMASAMGKGKQFTHRGIDMYAKYGFLPYDKKQEVLSRGEWNFGDYTCVSMSLEWAYADWCIAQMAQKMGKIAIADSFIWRANSYQRLFDTTTLFIRPRNSDGSWKSPFDPASFNPNDGYVEGNAWQYLWSVMHDVEGLVKLLKGKWNASQRLDSLFMAPFLQNELSLEPLTGTIGYCAMANEPSHHIPYMYNFVSQPWKTQKLVNLICTNSYRPARSGLPGNDDCGQTSAWYVFSAIGFYPVNGASLQYVIGTPMFEETSIDVGNNKKFVVRAKGISRYNYYIQSASLNGKPFNLPNISHEAIMQGGELVFEMGSKPSSWGL